MDKRETLKLAKSHVKKYNPETGLASEFVKKAAGQQAGKRPAQRAGDIYLRERKSNAV